MIKRRDDLKAHALEYLHEARRALPNASPKELRREIRRQLKRDGYGWSWILVIIKILAAILPLLFTRPKA